MQWLRQALARRPWWMNLLLAFCAYMTFGYVPWDFLCKPVEKDEEVWFGVVLRGWPAKLTEPLHWAIYAAGTYGFWTMRAWMHPWAALYVLQVGVASLVWGVTDERSASQWLAPVALLVFAALAAHLWRSRELFRARG